MRAHVPVTEVRGSRSDGRLIFMSLMTGMVAVGADRPQLGEVGKGIGRARLLCARLSFNSKFRHSTGIARSEGRGQGLCNKLCLAETLSL